MRVVSLIDELDLFSLSPQYLHLVNHGASDLVNHVRIQKVQLLVKIGCRLKFDILDPDQICIFATENDAGNK